MSQHDRYISPFSTRYSSDEMQYIFSDDNKFRTWRRLWVALARAEMEQGLTNITPEMVAELEAHVDDINYEVAIAREKLVRHDVMSHVYAYGQQCPKAAGIIHLGATSCYVGDNTDIIVMRQGLELIRKKLIGVLAKLSRFAEEYKDMPCMAYTHCQPAQPTTVGKRATLWANELVMDLAEIDHRLATLQLRGVKGTTGTQASFMELFKGDANKIRAVDASIAKEMGFAPDAVIPVSGQTYSRKVDAFILNALAGIAQSCMKFATDLRLLANFKEMEEPFEKNQIGSSAMPYKRNPMRCERICALSRYLMVDVLNPSFTTGTQWFERTLDDSANKRVAMAEGFLAGYPMVDVKCAVYDGSYHSVDSNEMAFKTAARIGFRAACEQATPVVLEPMATMSIAVGESYAGAVMGDISTRRGRIIGTDSNDAGETVIMVRVPYAEVVSYTKDLRSISRGSGSYTIELDGYEQAPADVQKKLVAEYEAKRAAGN